MRNGCAFQGTMLGAASAHDVSSLLVSVVVVTRARSALLLRCLRALARQTLPPHLYEIIVVDAGYADETRTEVARFALHVQGLPHVRYLRPPGGAHRSAAARNAGWRASLAPLIAFTDDDTLPDADWLRQGLRTMAEGHVAAGGRIVAPSGARDPAAPERAEFATANAFVRRDALAAVGGFDERFTRARCEDPDLQFSLLERGSVGRAADAVVMQPVREVRAIGRALAQQRRMYFDALLYKKHPALYRARFGAHAPWHHYVIVACTLAALLAALAGAGVAALAPAGVALSLICAFAMRCLAGTSHAPRHVAQVVLTSIAVPYLAVFWRLAGAVRFRVAFS